MNISKSMSPFFLNVQRALLASGAFASIGGALTVSPKTAQAATPQHDVGQERVLVDAFRSPHTILVVVPKGLSAEAAKAFDPEGCTSYAYCAR